MARTKTLFECTSCGAQSLKWHGQCPECEAWNTFEEARGVAPPRRRGGYSGESRRQRLGEVDETGQTRTGTGIGELDRVLGGGLVAGSVILLGGDPGIGKSTLLLQAAARLSGTMTVMYVTGEESLRQVALRARRLGLASEGIELLAETQIGRVIAEAADASPGVMIVDSIQTMFSEDLSSAPGSVSQLREATAQLVRYAKQSGCIIFLVGHVTKDGAIAGPRVLEHMVDTVLYFESEAGSRFRIVRAIKNRFGAANEMGVFAMSADGLKEVRNPSAIFLSPHDAPVAGSVTTVTREGSRPLLLELQALVDESRAGNPRRVAAGMDQNRLSLLLAILHRHGGVASYDRDVFVNVVGGIRISETAADLALLAAIVSSHQDHPLQQRTVIVGELGLAGEVRPVPFGEERIIEAAKHGFERAIVPNSNRPRSLPRDIEVVGVGRLAEALDALF
ncbi:MAG: DNA repair protein RadA [Gammaproteobacteria bacterium]